MESRQLLTTFLVTTTADNGPGSLRGAILLANAHPGADNIDFAIPASTSPNLDVPVAGFDPTTQTWRITLNSPLPTITDPINIDGYTQAEFPVPFRYPAQTSTVPLGNPTLISSNAGTAAAKDGNNAAIRVIVDGSRTGGATGFVLDTSHSDLRGLIIDGFGVGVSVPNPGDVGNLIQGNDIGQYFLFPVDPVTGGSATGANQAIFAGQGNSLQGVLIGSMNTTVGGTETQDANVITGNRLQGVSILPGANGNQVFGNQIGIAGPSLGGQFAIAPNGAEGVLIASASNSVGGAAPGAGNLISGNASHGVRIVGPLATRNNVQENFIGVGPGGGFLFGAGHPGNLGDGVRIENAGDNEVGGTTAADRNVISTNAGAGVRIFGDSAVRNQVQGNYIGLTADGISALGNSQEGVAIFSSGNVVNFKNVISTNLRGVLLSGPGAIGNRVQDNLIGTDPTGTADLGNAIEGVRIDNASDNVISGDAKGSQVISGNNVGLLIIGNAATRNQVRGNFIGTDITGTSDLGNSQEGVRIENAPGNAIGGSTATDRNLISANHWGVVITGPQSLFNVVQGNSIGTGLSGQEVLGNELDGVLANSAASRNLIGGTLAATGNTIAFNRRDGVRIEDASVSNSILSNQISANGELGINLAIPSGAGPNRLQNAPTLTAVATSVGSTIIRGLLNSTPNTTFTIQFFYNSPLDPTGRGEGGQFVGQTTAVSGADGVASYTVNLPTILKAGQFVTATATDPSGNTSEFSSPIAEVFGTVQFQMVGYTVDEGAGTATIVATRSGGSGGLFTVNFATSDRTAQSGSDYQPTSGTLTFNPGEDSKSFTIPIVDDGLPDADETVLLTLSNPSGAVTLGAQSTAVLTILGNQPGALHFQMAAYSVNEAAGTAAITVARNRSGGTAAVNYATSDGTARAGIDYVPTLGTLTFNPGELVKTFTIPILINPLIRGNETVNLNLSSPTGLATLGSPSTAVLVIVDDMVSRIGPHVTSVNAVSGPFGIASVVIAFDEPLDPARAVNLLNYGYSVRTAGRDGRLGTADDQLIGLCPATYNPATQTVTLPLARAIPAKTRLEIMINQATDVLGANVGVSDLAGHLLDGNSDGFPGGPFSAVVVSRPALSTSLSFVSKLKGHDAKPIKHAAAATPIRGQANGRSIGSRGTSSHHR